MKILGIEIPNNIMEVYTLWLEHMELKECEQTLIMFLQDVFIANEWDRKMPNFIKLYFEKRLGFVTDKNEGRYLNQINLENIKQQLNESSRTNL